jgi:hypothetical protein
MDVLPARFFFLHGSCRCKSHAGRQHQQYITWPSTAVEGNTPECRMTQRPSGPARPNTALKLQLSCW